MGFFSRLLGLTKPCPACGDPNATRNAAGQWICENPGCRNYRRDRVARHSPASAPAAPAAATPRSDGAAVQDLVAAVAADAFAEPIELHYTNARGEARVFVADRRSARDAGLFVTVRVKPKHRRIALRKTKLSPGELPRLLGS